MLRRRAGKKRAFRRRAASDSDEESAAAAPPPPSPAATGPARPTLSFGDGEGPAVVRKRASGVMLGAAPAPAAAPEPAEAEGRYSAGALDAMRQQQRQVNHQRPKPAPAPAPAPAPVVLSGDVLDAIEDAADFVPLDGAAAPRKLGVPSMLEAAASAEAGAADAAWEEDQLRRAASNTAPQPQSAGRRQHHQQAAASVAGALAEIDEALGLAAEQAERAEAAVRRCEADAAEAERAMAALQENLDAQTQQHAFYSEQRDFVADLVGCLREKKPMVDELSDAALAEGADRAKLAEAAAVVFADVADEFRSLERVMERFEAWRRERPGEYDEAFCALALPDLVAPFAMLEVAVWDPRHGPPPPAGWAWLRAVPDAETRAKVLGKTAVPHVERVLASAWDPASAAQAAGLAAAVAQLLETADSGARDKLTLAAQTRIAEAVNGLPMATAADAERAAGVMRLVRDEWEPVLCDDVTRLLLCPAIEHRLCPLLEALGDVALGRKVCGELEGFEVDRLSGWGL